MWKMAGVGAALTAAMLAAGGVALAGDTATPDTQSGTSTEEKEMQSGSEKSHSLKQIGGEHARKLQEGLKEQGFYEGKIDGVIGPITEEALRKFQESKGLAASGKLDSQTASALGFEISDVQPVRGTEEPLKKEEPAKAEGDDAVDPQSGEEALDKDAAGAKPTSTTDADAADSDLEKDKEPVSGEDADLQSGEAGTTGAHEGMNHGEHPASGNQPMGGVEGQKDPNVVNDSGIQPQAGTSSTFDKKTIKQVEKALKEKKLFTGKVDGVLDAETTTAIRKFQTDNGIVVTGQLDTRTLDALGVKSGASTDTTVDPQGGSSTTDPSTDPGTMSTPSPDETPIGTPSEPINPPTGNDPVQPNPGGMPPR